MTVTLKCQKRIWVGWRERHRLPKQYNTSGRRQTRENSQRPWSRKLSNIKWNYWAQKMESRCSCMRSSPPPWMRCLLLLARLDARRETPNGRRSCQLQSSTPKNALPMEASRKAEGNHPTRITRKKANREVRRVQRTHDAINRNTLLAEISAASENDQRLFHKLVRKQRA